MPDYRAKTDVWIGGTFHAEGSIIPLTERQARYYVRDGVLEVTGGSGARVPAAQPAPPPRRRRVSTATDPEMIDGRD